MLDYVKTVWGNITDPTVEWEGVVVVCATLFGQCLGLLLSIYGR